MSLINNSTLLPFQAFPAMWQLQTEPPRPREDTRTALRGSLRRNSGGAGAPWQKQSPRYIIYFTVYRLRVHYS